MEQQSIEPVDGGIIDVAAHPSRTPHREPDVAELGEGLLERTEIDQPRSTPANDNCKQPAVVSTYLHQRPFPKRLDQTVDAEPGVGGVVSPSDTVGVADLLLKPSSLAQQITVSPLLQIAQLRLDPSQVPEDLSCLLVTGRHHGTVPEGTSPGALHPGQDTAWSPRVECQSEPDPGQVGAMPLDPHPQVGGAQCRLITVDEPESGACGGVSRRTLATCPVKKPSRQTALDPQLDRASVDRGNGLEKTSGGGQVFDVESDPTG